MRERDHLVRMVQRESAQIHRESADLVSECFCSTDHVRDSFAFAMQFAVQMIHFFLSCLSERGKVQHALRVLRQSGVLLSGHHEPFLFTQKGQKHPGVLCPR